MRYLMTWYVGAAPITSFSRTSGEKLMETVRGNDWKYLYCNDLLLFFWKSQTFRSSDNTGKKWCYTTGWNSGCGDLVKSQRFEILAQDCSSWFDLVNFVTLDKKDPFPVFYPWTSHRYSNNPWSYEACSGGGSVPSNFIRSGWICNKQFSTFSHFNHLWLILHETHWK